MCADVLPASCIGAGAALVVVVDASVCVVARTVVGCVLFALVDVAALIVVLMTAADGVLTFVLAGAMDIDALMLLDIVAERGAVVREVIDTVVVTGIVVYEK
jgi:hypothetical protein